VVSAAARREAVGWLQARGFSQRRSCHLTSLSRCGARYTSHKRAGDEQLANELHTIAIRYKRFGYRRAHAALMRTIRLFAGRKSTSVLHWLRPAGGVMILSLPKANSLARWD